jgi:hypothetical protein
VRDAEKALQVGKALPVELARLRLVQVPRHIELQQAPQRGLRHQQSVSCILTPPALHSDTACGRFDSRMQGRASVQHLDSVEAHALHSQQAISPVRRVYPVVMYAATPAHYPC